MIHSKGPSCPSALKKQITWTKKRDLDNEVRKKKGTMEFSWDREDNATKSKDCRGTIVSAPEQVLPDV